MLIRHKGTVPRSVCSTSRGGMNDRANCDRHEGFMNGSSDVKSFADIEPLPRIGNHDRVSLCEALDRMLNTGVVVAGEVVISVADVDLIYLNLQLLLTSVATATRQPWRAPDARASQECNR